MYTLLRKEYGGVVKMFRILLVLVLLPVQSYRQPLQNYNDGCTPQVIEILEPILTEINYTALCEAYLTCNPDGDMDDLCQFRALDALMQDCETGDSFCQTRAMLYVTTLEIFDVKPYFDYLPDAPETIFENVLHNISIGLIAFEEHDYLATTSAYYKIQQQQTAANIMPTIGHAVLSVFYETIRTNSEVGGAEFAIQEYNAAMLRYPASPLIYYGRYQAYEYEGQLVEASFDALWLEKYAQKHPEFRDLVAPIVEAYPFDRSRLSNWTLYPLVDLSEGPCCAVYTDLTQEPASPVQLAYFEEIGKLVAVGLYPQAVWGDVTVFPLTEENHYQIVKEVALGSKVYLTLESKGDIFDITYWQSSIESGNGRMFVLTRAGLSDARNSIHGQRCGAVSRMRRAVKAVAYDPLGGSMDVFLYDEPDGEILFSFELATILDESRCIDGVLWWKVQVEHSARGDFFGRIGWTPENKGRRYLLNRLPPLDRPYSTVQIPYRRASFPVATPESAPVWGQIISALNPPLLPTSSLAFHRKQ
jgi:hypothetical protein